jgi:dTDP-4-dehydrorhamnose reductase
MKVLVTGAKGQLGYDVVAEMRRRNMTCQGVDKEAFDLADRVQVREYILAYQPDAVIHCAAYTAVDKAEEEPATCYAVNVLGTSYVAQACKAIDAKMIYISTDYVFDGDGDRPFETEGTPAPIGQYGLSKWQGEEEVKKYLNKYFIARTSWVFGSNGSNFIKTMLKLGKERAEVNVVCDQIGSPTYTLDLARLLGDMITTDQYGIYHITNEGECSWYEFACEIFRQAGYTTKVNPVTSEQYPTKAKRPKNSRLSKRSLAEQGFQRMPYWQDALARYLKGMER